MEPGLPRAVDVGAPLLPWGSLRHRCPAATDEIKDSEPRPGTRAPRKQRRLPPAPRAGLTCTFRFRLSQKGNGRLTARAAAQCRSLTERRCPGVAGLLPHLAVGWLTPRQGREGSRGAARGFWPGRPEEGCVQFRRATTPHSVGAGVTYPSPLGVIRPAPAHPCRHRPLESLAPSR